MRIKYDIFCVILDIDAEDIRDPETGQKQVVFRQSTLTEPLSLRAPLNPNAIVTSTNGWKAAHGKNEILCVVVLLFVRVLLILLFLHF